MRTIADDLAFSRRLDLEVIDLAKRVDALETRVRVVRAFLFTGISAFVALITGLGAFPDIASGIHREEPFFGRGVGTRPTP